MPHVTSIVLADDHTLMRETLRSRLNRESDLSVVAVAANAGEAVARCEERHADVVLMDIDMPGMDCFAAARRIREESPTTRVIFLSAFSHDRYIESALAAQASGYLTKDEPVEVVIAAIRKARSGIAYFSPAVQSRIVVDSEGASLSKPARSLGSLLSDRELEILRYIARGLSKKDIAAELDLSPKTVDNHSMNLMRKLDIHDRVELARYAIREGLAEP